MPEQLMSIIIINPNSKVLELGGRYRRNRCIIASILNNSAHLVTLETDPISADMLRINCDLNGFKFHVGKFCFVQ